MLDTTAQDVDTGLYVYAVLRAADATPLGLPGIDGGEVEFVEYGDIAAAVGTIVLDRPPGRRAELVAHGDVVNALAAHGPVAPVRFGSVMADEAAVTDDLLAASHDDYVALLEELRGTVQLNLRATYLQDRVLGEVVRDRPDIADLRGQTKDLPEAMPDARLIRLGELVAQEMAARREHDAASVMEAIRPWVRAESVRGGAGVDHLLDVAILVEDRHLPEVERRLEELAEAMHERVRMQLTGPVAPFDFVEEMPWD